MNDQTKKTTHSSSSTRSQVASCTGNFETLGSKFRHETRFCEAAAALATID